MKICKCNNCGLVLEDMNPSESSLEIDDFKDMEKVTDKDGSFWACPMCKKDDYLMDIESIDEVALRGV